MKKISAIQYTALIITVLTLSMSYVYFYNTGNYDSPVIKFEFSKSTQDVNSLFMENNEFKKDVIKGVHDQNMVDYAYMIAYSSFIILIFIKLIKTERKNIYYLGILLSVSALIFDIAENIQLFRIQESLFSRIDFSENISNLIIFTWIKWLSLSFVLLLMSYHYYKYKFIGKLFAIISALPIVLALITLLLNNYELYFSSSVMLGFLLIIIWIFISVLVSTSVSFYNKA